MTTFEYLNETRFRDFVSGIDPTTRRWRFVTNGECAVPYELCKRVDRTYAPPHNDYFAVFLSTRDSIHHVFKTLYSKNFLFTKVYKWPVIHSFHSNLSFNNICWWLTNNESSKFAKRVTFPLTSVLNLMNFYRDKYLTWFYDLL